jgi:P-type conjugative transfer protein TrbJ
MRRLSVLKFAFVVLLCTSPWVSIAAGIPVIDAANLVQNTITAVEVVAAVLQRVTIIAQQLEQLKNMIQNTQNFSAGTWEADALPRLEELGQMIDQGKAVAYQMENLDAAFRQRWPGYVPPEDFNASYDLWTQTILDTIRGVLRSSQLQADGFLDEQTRLEAIQELSDSAVGRMQALQAGNMIAVEGVQQLRKLRQLVLAQSNAQTVYMANQTNKDAQETASLRSWLLQGASAADIGNGLTGNGAKAGGLPTLTP